MICASPLSRTCPWLVGIEVGTVPKMCLVNSNRESDSSAQVVCPPKMVLSFAENPCLLQNRPLRASTAPVSLKICTFFFFFFLLLISEMIFCNLTSSLAEF